MNDNRDNSRDVEIHLPAYFLIDEGLFDLFRFLPDFRTVDVCERRLAQGQGRQLLIQVADHDSFIHVTAYRFDNR